MNNQPGLTRVFTVGGGAEILIGFMAWRSVHFSVENTYLHVMVPPQINAMLSTLGMLLLMACSMAFCSWKLLHSDSVSRASKHLQKG